MKESAEPNSDRLKAEFRQKLENYKAAPSANLWDRIDLSLEKEEALVYKNRLRIYARLAAACLLLLIAFSAVFVTGNLQRFNPQGPNVATITNNPAPKTTSGKEAKAIFDNSPGGNKALALYQADNNPAPGAKQKETVKANPETVAEGSEKVKAAAKNTVSPLTAAASGARIQNPETGSPATGNPLPSGGASATGFSGKINAAPFLVLAGETQTVATTETDSKKARYGLAALSTGNAFKYKLAGKNILSEEVAFALNRNYATQFTEKSNSRTVTEAEQAFAGNKAPGIPAEELNKPAPLIMVLPETLLALQPLEADEPVLKEKSALAGSRWGMRVMYAGSGFKSGMALATNVEELPVQEPESTLLPPGLSDPREQGVKEYKAAIQEFNHTTRAAYSSRLNVLLGYKLTGKFSLESGLALTQNRAISTSGYLFRGTGSGSSGGTAAQFAGATSPGTVLQTVMAQDFQPYSPVTRTAAFETEYRFYYVGIPVNLRFQTGQKAIRYFAATGVSFNKLLRAETHNQHPEFRSVTVENQYYRQWLPSLMLQTGVGYKFAENWQLEAALEGTQYLKPLISDESLAGRKQQNPQQLGVTLGVGYSF